MINDINYWCCPPTKYVHILLCLSQVGDMGNEIINKIVFISKYFLFGGSGKKEGVVVDVHVGGGEDGAILSVGLDYTETDLLTLVVLEPLSWMKRKDLYY